MNGNHSAPPPLPRTKIFKNLTKMMILYRFQYSFS